MSLCIACLGGVVGDVCLWCVFVFAVCDAAVPLPLKWVFVSESKLCDFSFRVWNPWVVCATGEKGTLFSASLVVRDAAFRVPLAPSLL
jgi:hypothetical protein